MGLRNYMEDVVRDVLEILLRERGETKSPQCKLDIIAFSLNRLPPKYIVSERGFTHSYIEELNNVKWKGDVIATVNLGIDIISKRPRKTYEEKIEKEHQSKLNALLTDKLEELYTIEDNVYYYNFPHFIGQVYDKDEYLPLDETTVLLYLDDVKALSEDKSWQNPYITKKVTKGFYSFWPKSIKVHNKSPETKKFHFKLSFSHSDFHTNIREFYIAIIPEKIHYNFIRRNFTEKIDITLMKKRRR